MSILQSFSFSSLAKLPHKLIEIRLECEYACKNVSSFENMMFAVYDTKQRNSFLIKFGVFYNKIKILTLLFIVIYVKITLFDEFLVLLGPIISRFFACSNEEKNKQKQQRVLALVLSLCISYTVCPWQAFPTWFNICGQGQEPTKER